MSKNDLQETNVAKEKTLTIDDIRATIIGDQNKLILLSTIKQIPDLILKNIATNQSLYI